MATSQLPVNPHPARVDEYCSAYALSHSNSSGARVVARKGWIITSDTKLGAFDAISFVGELVPVTSATCAHLHGNLAIFDGGKLLAIAYEALGAQSVDPDDPARQDSLGSAEQIDSRRIRLSYGLPSPPFADIVLRDGISVEPIAKQDVVCGGAAVVPDVFGLDIHQARRILTAKGWSPRKPVGDEPGPDELSPVGVPEVESCSGTGYGFCAYNYRHTKRFGLRIISSGEDHLVTSYSTDCEG